jgi:hypothetical protein
MAPKEPKICKHVIAGTTRQKRLKIPDTLENSLDFRKHPADKDIFLLTEKNLISSSLQLIPGQPYCYHSSP